VIRVAFENFILGGFRRMKNILLISVALFALMASTAFAENDDEKWDRIEKARFDEWQLSFRRCSDELLARVQSITPQADGTMRVVFHADGRYGSRQGREEQPVENFSRDYALVWPESARPMPWINGQQVQRLGMRGADVIVVRLGDVKIMYCRKRSDGEVEVLTLMVDSVEATLPSEPRGQTHWSTRKLATVQGSGLAKEGVPRWLLIHPNRLGTVQVGMVDLDWVRGIGIVMTAGAAGDAGDEVEGPGRRGVGLVPVNVPERIVQPGRDGWQDGDSFFYGKVRQDLIPPSFSYVKVYRDLVPPSQRIYCAG
jgi:hypothetical protein